jgi:hypothetical protein
MSTRILSTCRLCRTAVAPEDAFGHAQRHRGPITISITSRRPTWRRRSRRMGRNRKWQSGRRRFYLPVVSAGAGSATGAVLFGSFMAALICGVLALAAGLWWRRR